MGSYGAFPPSACGGENRAGLFPSMPVVDGIVRGFFPLSLWLRELLGAVSLYARGRRDRTGLFPSMLVVERIARGCFDFCPWLRELLGAVSLYAVVDGIARGYFPLSLWERAGVRASDPTTRRRYPSDGVPPKFNNL